MGPLEERGEFRVVEWSAGRVRVDLQADGAEIARDAHCLGDGRVGIVQRQRPKESGESIGMCRDDRRQAVVADPLQVGCPVGAAEGLDWRRPE